MASLFAAESCFVHAQYYYGDVSIREDGQVEGTSNIQRNGNVYTFTGNVTGNLGIQRDNIIVDGQGYTLKEQGEAYEINIVLANRSNVVIKNIRIERGHGILLDTCSRITVSGLNLSHLSAGVNLWGTSGSTVENNTITSCSTGLMLVHAQSNIVRDNLLSSNGLAMSFGDDSNYFSAYLGSSSSGNVFRNNNLTNNQVDIDLSAYASSLSYVNDIDRSNTVNGKPIYYWVNQQGRTVPDGAGCVVLVNCARIAVQGLSIQNGGRGILLFRTTDSTVTKNNITESKTGIRLVSSIGNTITENLMACQRGIELIDSSSNNITGNSFVGTGKSSREMGIEFSHSNNNLIADNKIKAYYAGIFDRNNPSAQNTLRGNEITNCTSGISCLGEMTISNNAIEGNDVGILVSGNSSTLTGNAVKNNVLGISLEGSDNTLRKNAMQNNGINFYVEEPKPNSVDGTNTVNGKSVCYWVNQQGRTVPFNAGYVCLLSCTNITVSNLQLQNNVQGIAMFDTNQSTITNNTITANSQGILVVRSNGNLISRNYIANNSDYGILCNVAEANSIVENAVTANHRGMAMRDDCKTNTIAGNLLKENSGFAMEFTSTQTGNLIYRNDFVNNKVTEGLQVWMLGGTDTPTQVANPDVWDNGFEGNYWSDYRTRYPNATEIGTSGIGDTAFYINENNIDRYPLMNPTTNTPLPAPSPEPSPSQSPTPSPSETPIQSIQPSASPETTATISKIELIVIVVVVAAMLVIVLAIVIDMRRKANLSLKRP